MFDKLPHVLSADDLLDLAFRRTKKVNITDRNAHFRKKKEVIAKTDSFVTTILDKMEAYVKEFPSIDNLHAFYQELIQIQINRDQLKKSLGAVDWARKVVFSIYTKQTKSLRKTRNLEFLQQKQKEIFGRVSSVIKQVNAELCFLKEAEQVMKLFPHILDIPTVVIAGYPNVGKSSLLRCLSKARPQVAQYPFTTKEIYIGHMDIKQRYETVRVQLIDTPGLLDRPMEKRNDIEHQAIAALRHLADIIVFVMDPTETCGYSREDQHGLLEYIQSILPEVQVIIVENKCDVGVVETEHLKISCEDKSGIDELNKKMSEIIIENNSAGAGI